METGRRVRYNRGMSKTVTIILLCLCLLAIPALADGPPVLAKKAHAVLADFAHLPERNYSFHAEGDADTVYRLVYALLLELDYIPTANAVQQGDLIGPMLSKHMFRRDKLAEATMVRLTENEQGVELTIRGIYVVPDRQNLLDQSDRRPSRTVRKFKSLFEAKSKLYEQTENLNTYELLAGAKQNLTARANLESTLALLELIEQATSARCLAGRQARELAHAVTAEIARQKKLNEAAQQMREEIKQAMAERNWLAAHLAADKLLHTCLSNEVNKKDALFQEALKARETSRRRLAALGSLVIFNEQLAPAEENDFAVGFSILNVGRGAVSSFKVIVATTDDAGQPTAGRIGRNHAYTVELSPPLKSNEYATATVRLRFEHPAVPVHAKARVVGVKR